MEIGRIVLDTSAYSAFLKGSQEIKIKLQSAEEICLSPVVLGELLAGFMAGKNEKKNREILSEFLSSSRVRIIPIDDETSERYGVIVNYLRSAGTPIPANDIWIAASAMQHGLKIVTTDRHYLAIPQVITDYCQV